MRGVGEAARIMLEKRAASDLEESDGKNLAGPNIQGNSPPENSGLDETGDIDQDP
jgi:hypothetical protein